MKLMKRVKFFLLSPIVILCSCSAVAHQRYEETLRDVKSVAIPGRDMYSVKSELKKRGYGVYGPYDPTKLGNRFCMDVYHGATPGSINGVLYASGIASNGPPSGILIDSNGQGRVVNVR